jgi:hypothetical protein
MKNMIHACCMQGFRLTSRPVPPSICQNLKVLVVEQVTADSGVLAELLSHCHQLEELQLLRTRVEGSCLQLSVLSKLPSLSLTLNIEEASLPEDQQPLAFLQHLGPCLTALDVETRSDEDRQSTVPGTVLGYATRNLPRLKHLTVSDYGDSYTESVAEQDVLLGLAASPSAQQLETLTLNGIELPDMECAVKLLCMPNLKLLGGKLSSPARDDDLPASLDMPWPEGKPPMELQLETANVRQLAALPLEHFSSISITSLGLHVRASDQVQAMQALLAAARKCLQFVIGGVGVYTGPYPVPVMLQAMGADCPIKLSNSGCFECVCMRLDASDVQGISAAWGPQLKQLIFQDAYPSSSAWAAITPAAFPLLERIRLTTQLSLEWVPDLSVFCIQWPAGRKLSIAVSQPSDGLHGQYSHEEQLAAKLKEILETHGRQNIAFTFEWED